MIRRLALLGLLSIFLSGCMNLTGHSKTYGYKSYDPCIRCGESWIFLPHTPSRD